MNYAEKRKAFFQEHLKDRIQDEYELSDNEMDGLVSFFSKFEEDPSSLLRNISKPINKEHLRKVVTELYGKSVNNDSYKDMDNTPHAPSTGLSFPVGLPLTDNMII